MFTSRSARRSRAEGGDQPEALVASGGNIGDAILVCMTGPSFTNDTELDLMTALTTLRFDSPRQSGLGQRDASWSALRAIAGDSYPSAKAFDGMGLFPRVEGRGGRGHRDAAVLSMTNGSRGIEREYLQADNTIGAGAWAGGRTP
jgi:hypothetical protein